MIVQDLLRNSVVFLWEENFLAGHMIRFAPQQSYNRDTVANPLTARLFPLAKKGWNTVSSIQVKNPTSFRWLSFNSFFSVHFVSAWSQKVYKYRNALWDSFENFARATSYFRFIQKYYKSKITSLFPNFDHRTLWQMSHNSRWYHFEIDTVLREEVIIDFRLVPLASGCKLSPRALKKALFISWKAKHASLPCIGNGLRDCHAVKVNFGSIVLVAKW